MTTFLVTGALGQVGTELTLALRTRYGVEAVLATDMRRPAPGHPLSGGPYEPLDCTDARALDELVARRGPHTVYHLAALLSAVAEARPLVAWQVNMQALVAVLEAARTHHLRVFVPSSIAVFGPTTPRDHTPQDTLQRPTSMYGITKVAGELLCDYYHARYGVDVRGLRYPGLISHRAPPGGGTTDYAVEMFRAAARGEVFPCPLLPGTALPMMYMPDALRATLELMDADPVRLAHRNAYNVAAMTFTPGDLAREIRRHLPGFEVRYVPEAVRQGIADGWPRRLDDSAAREEWGWAPRFSLAATTADMLAALRRPTAEDA